MIGPNAVHNSWIAHHYGNQCISARFISFDSYFDKIADTCVGSHRYEVAAETEGGHSFLAFGNRNAIAELSRIVR